MISKNNLKNTWLTFGVFSMALTSILWFGYDSPTLQNTIHVLDAFVLMFSLPCSLFAIPVIVLANHYLGINPFSPEGIYLATIFLFVLGFMQWFWIVRFWSPDESPLQNLNLLEGKS